MKNFKLFFLLLLIISEKAYSMENSCALNSRREKAKSKNNLIIDFFFCGLCKCQYQHSDTDDENLRKLDFVMHFRDQHKFCNYCQQEFTTKNEIMQHFVSHHK